jgi:hypothetical protein
MKLDVLIQVLPLPVELVMEIASYDRLFTTKIRRISNTDERYTLLLSRPIQKINAYPKRPPQWDCVVTFSHAAGHRLTRFPVVSREGVTVEIRTVFLVSGPSNRRSYLYALK